MASTSPILIEDILCLIFNELLHDLPALARSAQVCRTFTEPALDVLWKNLPRWLPLQILLPPMSFERPLHPNEWNRFDFYAKRIHWVPQDCSHYAFWCKARPGILPLPNLRGLTLASSPTRSSKLLLPQSLVTLDITEQTPSENGSESVVPDKVRRLHNLKNLTIRGCLSPALSAAVGKLRSLRSLNITYVKFPTAKDRWVIRGLLTSLSQHPRLNSLDLPICGLTDREMPTNPGFNHVQRISVHCNSAAFHALREIMASTGVREIYVGCGHAFLRSESTFEWIGPLQQFLLYLGSSLRSIDLSLPSIGGLSAMEIIDPLLELHELEEFNIMSFASSFSATSISPHDITSIASAWTKLTTINMRFMIHVDLEQDQVGSGLRCLATFARLCPHLINLHLLTDDPSIPDIGEWPMLNHSLRYLEIYAPSISDPPKVVRLVDRLFPTLEKVDFTTTDDEEMFLWASASSMLKMLQSVREEARSGTAVNRW